MQQKDSFFNDGNMKNKFVYPKIQFLKNVELFETYAIDHHCGGSGDGGSGGGVDGDGDGVDDGDDDGDGGGVDDGGGGSGDGREMSF